MANLIEKFLGLWQREPARPFSEQGVPGTPVLGGYPSEQETNPSLTGSQRWRTASEILANVSIVAAGVRMILNLASRPKWIVEPPSDRAEAKAVAEFIESVLYGGRTPFPRIVRRSAMYRFHGFGIQEWVAKRRDDGRIGFLDILPRPQHTIERWDMSPKNELLGVEQRSPFDGKGLYLPRRKIIYLVDDALTDSPQGMGWFRHLAEHADRLKEYLKMEEQGFERDLRGVPIGRAPLSQIEALKKAGTISPAEAKAMTEGIRRFIEMQKRAPNTGLMLDSKPYEGQTADGKTISPVMQWGIELLTGDQTSIEQLGDAIRRTQFDMAIILGVENLLVGREGAGSMALSSDKSRNLYMNINSTNDDMAQAFSDDMLDPIMAMNGIPEELRPKLKTEDASFKDVEQVGKTLRDMGAAGAILAPDDPAIDDVRDLLGISRQPEMTPERMGMLMGQGKEEDGSQSGRGEEDDDEGLEGKEAKE